MKGLLEHFKRIPPAVWIGVLITVVVAIVVTRWTANRTIQAAAQGAMTGSSAAASGNAAGAAQAAGVDSVTTSSFLQMQTSTLSKLIADTQAQTLSAMNANTQSLADQMKASNAALQESNKAAITDVTQQFTNSMASYSASLNGEFQRLIEMDSTKIDATNQALSSLANAQANTNSQLGAALAAIQNAVAQAVHSAAQAPAIISTGYGGGGGGSGPGNSGSSSHVSGNNVVSYSGHTYDLGSDSGRSQLINDAANNVVPSGPGGNNINRILRAHPPQ